MVGDMVLSYCIDGYFYKYPPSFTPPPLTAQLTPYKFNKAYILSSATLYKVLESLQYRPYP